MLWFWFVIGLIMAVAGILLIAYDDDICIKELYFDSETLGWGLAGVGGILAALMLFGNGIMWLISTGA